MDFDKSTDLSDSRFSSCIRILRKHSFRSLLRDVTN